MKKIFKKPILFMVVGKPGSGKSWFSKNLSKQVGAVRIDAERIRYELFDEQQYSDDENIVVENLVDYFTHTLLEVRDNIIIDGSAQSLKRRKYFSKLAEDSGYATILIWVQSNDELAKVRSLGPKDTAIDSYKRQLTDDLYSSIDQEMQAPTEKEDPVVVSGSHSSRAQLKSIVTRLNDKRLLAISAPGVTPAKATQKTTSDPVATEAPKVNRRNTQRPTIN